MEHGARIVPATHSSRDQAGAVRVRATHPVLHAHGTHVLQGPGQLCQRCTRCHHVIHHHDTQAPPRSPVTRNAPRTLAVRCFPWQACLRATCPRHAQSPSRSTGSPQHAAPDGRASSAAWLKPRDAQACRHASGIGIDQIGLRASRAAQPSGPRQTGVTQPADGRTSGPAPGLIDVESHSREQHGSRSKRRRMAAGSCTAGFAERQGGISPQTGQRNGSLFPAITEKHAVGAQHATAARHPAGESTVAGKSDRWPSPPIRDGARQALDLTNPDPFRETKRAS
jgi:hypothetical protein